MTTDLIKKLFDEIPKARDVVYDIGDATPLENIRLNGETFDLSIKREDLGPINAYKWRGGYNAVLNHHKNTGCDTIVAASAGNHAQGVALAARKLKIHAKIFMPLAAPIMKQKAVQRHGGDYVELMLAGDTYNEAGDAAKAYVKEHGHTYIHPFDDIYTMAGQAMIADEIINQSDTPFDYAFLQIGGGGMAGATAAMLKTKWPDIKIIGVEGEDQASMKTSVENNALTTLDSVDTFCDGTAVTRPGDITFEVCKTYIDDFMTVTNDDVAGAMRQLWEAKRLIPEPSGAMGVAGVRVFDKSNPDTLKGKKVLTIICGANMDFSKLSTIARKSSVGGNKRYYYQIELPEHKSALLKLLEKHFKDFNVAEFMCGKTDQNIALQTIGLDATPSEIKDLEDSLTTDNLVFKDVSNDADIKYRVINYNPQIFIDPLFMNIEFAERKGALRDFLRAIAGTANICYFNYAYSGEIIGRALMGFEFQDDAHKSKFLDAIKNTNTKCDPIDSQIAKRILNH